jgi:hypothetical protein
MKHEVPQFIDIQDKIFGPFTFQQFIYLLGGAGAVYLIWTYFPGPLKLLVLPVGGFAGALVFVKINGRSFMEVSESFMTFNFGSKLFIWKHKKVPPKLQYEFHEEEMKKRAKAKEDEDVPLTNIALHDLSSSLDILDKNMR